MLIQLMSLLYEFCRGQGFINPRSMEIRKSSLNNSVELYKKPFKNMALSIILKETEKDNIDESLA